ncbi:MAG: hypothetical protein HUJ31_00830, partial [Pseudomonadales bacterium]|nr:hypothetical protein [Pseudomonadales bacterium]
MFGRDVLPVGLLAIAFSLAIFFYGGDSTPWLTWSAVILLIAGLIRLQQVLAAGSFTWSPVHGWTFGYVAWLGALIWLSTLGENSRLYFWVMGSFTLVFLLSANLPRERWLWAFGLLMISGLFSATWGLAEFIETGKRANGPIVDPSTWGSLHNMFFFAGMAVL